MKTADRDYVLIMNLSLPFSTFIFFLKRATFVVPKLHSLFCALYILMHRPAYVTAWHPSPPPPLLLTPDCLRLDSGFHGNEARGLKLSFTRSPPLPSFFFLSIWSVHVIVSEISIIVYPFNSHKEARSHTLTHASVQNRTIWSDYVGGPERGLHLQRNGRVSIGCATVSMQNSTCTHMEKGISTESTEFVSSDSVSRLSLDWTLNKICRRPNVFLCKLHFELRFPELRLWKWFKEASVMWDIFVWK